MSGTTEGAKKAAETRKEKDPKAFEKMGSKGGKASGGGGRKSEEGEEEEEE